MSEQDVNAPEAEVIAPVETTTEETQQTISDISEEAANEVENTYEAPTVPEHVFVAQKKALKAAEKELSELRQSIQNGATSNEIATDVDEIAERYDIDKGFLQDLTSTIKAQTEKEIDAKYASKLGAKEKAEKFETAFNKAYATALERGPEFGSIANAEVIKQLAMLPQNSKKTISQILEETYGNALTGKRTIETTKPGGGKDPEPLDYDRANTDTEYFNEVMADPKKKAQFNEIMLKKGF